MKFSQNTIDILKNFATINTGLIFPVGHELSTKSGMNAILATAEIEEEIQKRFAIYDLNEFLGVLTMFDSPDMELNENHVLISSGKNKIKYFYSNENNIAAPKTSVSGLIESNTQSKRIGDPEIEFVITKQEIDQLNKASSVMKLVNLGINSSGIRAFIPDVPASNDFLLNVDITSTTDKEYQIKIENLKLFPGNYNVKCYEAGLTYWTNTETSNKYIITMEKKPT